MSEAAQAQPVDLVATITADFTRFGHQVLFVDDNGEGIYIYPNWETTEYRVGDLVRVTGVTSDGNFAPEIIASEILPLGNGPVPHPRAMTFSQLLPGNHDSQWVEVTGYVRETGIEDRIAYLSLTDGNSTLRVRLASTVDPKELQGAVVRLTGNAGTLFNSRRQVVGIQLWCPSPRLVTPEEPPRADPFTVPEEELSELRRFRPGSTRLRWTRVEGVVTAVVSPRQVLVQNDGTAALVTFAQDAKLNPGYAVEVAGLIYWDGERTELGESVFRTKGLQPLPPAISLPLPIGEDPKQDLEGVRVRFEGELANVHREPNHLRISLIAEEPIDVICPPSEEANALRELTRGSRLAVEGSMLFDRRDAVGRRSPRCYLASASHVEVLYRAPWWTLRHTLTAFGWTGVLGLAALAWVRSLRHQVADKTREVQARLQREAQLEHINAELVFAASEIIFSHDQTGCIRSFNPAAELITGYKAAEIIGRPLLDFVAPEDAARAKALLTQVISNIKLERQEIRCMRADRSRIWMEISIHPLPSQHDGPRFGGIARDITDRKRAEESLRTNEKNLRNILESLADAVLLINSKGTITFANTQVRQIFGLEPASLINAPAEHLLTPGPIDRLISALSETETDGRPASTLSSMTVQASRCDGTLFPADLSLALVSHASRRAGMICVRDATRRITAEATLREQALIAGLEAAIAKILSAPTTEARMFNLCAHAVAERLHAAAIGVWMLDEDGTTLELHAAAGTIPLGNSPFGNVPSTDPFLGRVVRDGEPVNIHALPSETPTSMRAWCAGHKIDCFFAQPIIVGNQPVGALAAFAVGNTSGEHRRGLASVAVAISTSIDRLRTQESVARTNETLRAILDSAPVAIVEVAIDGRVRGLWNRAAVSLFGWPLEEVIGENLGPIIGMPGDQASMLQNRLLKGETITGWEVTRTRKDGSIVECSVYAAPLYGPNRRVHGSVQVILDLTERRRLEQESERIQQKLREAQRLESLGVLAGGIAHDFNNILGTILGNADLADFDVRPGSSMAEALAEIRGGARRAAELCRLMLAYAGKASMQTAPADLTAVVRDTVQLVRHSISKKARLVLELAEELPQFEGDTAQVQQVIMNLITNASDALPDQTGSIRITTGVMHASRSYLQTTYLSPDLPEGRYVFAEVEDTGCGMSPEVVQRIFDPFFTTKFTGRGLGLAAGWGIIGRHKGALHVASQPQKGTTFRILLPALTSTRAHPGTPPPAPRPTALAKSNLVVVIDDEPSLRTYVTRHFARAGILTATAEDGVAGEALVRERLNEISLVVLDLTMPRADGAETLARIRAFAPELPVVIMSGYSAQNVRERLQNHRFISFLGKPFTGTELDEAAANAIGQLRNVRSQPNPSDPPAHGSPA